MTRNDEYAYGGIQRQRQSKKVILMTLDIERDESCSRGKFHISMEIPFAFNASKQKIEETKIAFFCLFHFYLAHFKNNTVENFSHSRSHQHSISASLAGKSVFLISHYIVRWKMVERSQNEY